MTWLEGQIAKHGVKPKRVIFALIFLMRFLYQSKGWFFCGVFWDFFYERGGPFFQAVNLLVEQIAPGISEQRCTLGAGNRWEVVFVVCPWIHRLVLQSEPSRVMSCRIRGRPFLQQGEVSNLLSGGKRTLWAALKKEAFIVKAQFIVVRAMLTRIVYCR